jgi:hypothetical protein
MPHSRTNEINGTVGGKWRRRHGGADNFRTNSCQIAKRNPDPYLGMIHTEAGFWMELKK